MASPLLPALSAGVALFFLASTATAETIQEYNIFAVPSAPVADLVAKVGDDLKARGVETFYTKGFRPHATLYLTAFKADSLDAVKAKVQEIASHWKPFPLKIEGSHLTKGRWYFLDIVPNETLRALSDEVVKATASLRDPAYAPPAWMKDYPEKVAIFNDWGSPNVFANYQPHLTQIASENNPALDAFIKDNEGKPFKADGEIVALGFAPVDPLGQVKAGTEVLFPLSK